MSVIGGKGKLGDLLLRQLPHRDRIRLLVSGVDRLQHLQRELTGLCGGMIDFRREQRILLFFIVHYELPIGVRRDEKVLRARDPSDMGDRGLVDDPILVDACVFLRDGLVPDDIAGGGSHDDIDVRWAFGQVVHVVTEHMCFCKEDLGKWFLLVLGTDVQPLECAIDVRESEYTGRVSIVQSFGDGFVGDDSGDERGAALDDVVFRLPSLDAFLHRRGRQSRISLAKERCMSIFLRLMHGCFRPLTKTH